ncbi:unnamed protein product [Lampetra fluviatilis]
MKRPDFPSGHDGWQAVEAIPQEASSGNAHLSVAKHAPQTGGTGSSRGDNTSGAGGPGGVERAEDAADIGRALDVCSIVNSDSHLIVSPGGDPIGAPTGRDPGGDPPPPEVTLTVRIHEETALGRELTAEVRVARRSTRPRVSVQAMRPRTRAPTWVGSRRRLLLELGPHEERRVLVRVPASEYLHLAVDHFALVLVVCARVLYTGAEVARVMEGTHVGRDLISELCFTNPVARALHRVCVRVEGAGVHAPGNILVGDVEGHGRMRVVPKRRGELTLIASLDCTELPQVHGGATFQCEP